MSDKHPGPVFAYVEKAYLRLQAGDILVHCLEDGTTGPIDDLIQEMVIAGPQSLDALREILGEAMGRKTQIYDDLNQVTNQLSSILASYGIPVGEWGANHKIQAMTEEQLNEIMHDRGITERESQTACLQALQNSRELFASLLAKIKLLENIETSLQDWLWGLTYQSMRYDSGDKQAPQSKSRLL